MAALQAERLPLAARLDAIDLALENLRRAWALGDAPEKSMGGGGIVAPSGVADRDPEIARRLHDRGLAEAAADDGFAGSIQRAAHAEGREADSSSREDVGGRGVT